MSTETQREIFLSGEADQWFERNKSVLDAARDDAVVRSLRTLDIQPKRILEIGCANGWRLEQLRRVYGASCVGIEPSAKAVEEGRKQYPDLDLSVGSADVIPFEDGGFDLVIFGFCFYLIDPALHFRCVAEADRVLANEGLLAIFDFLTPIPYHNTYSHRPGVRSHKLEISRYFLANPGYNLIGRALDSSKGGFLDPDRREGVDILLKNMTPAYPQNPYAPR